MKAGRGTLLLLAAAWAGAAGAADLQAGRSKAGSCAVCHGPLGLSMVPNAPHLAGQPALYLAEQLRAFRSGRRPHEVMAVVARPLSDSDIEDLAAWYASLQLQVREP